jgi:hypothetical protein
MPFIFGLPLACWLVGLSFLSFAEAEEEEEEEEEEKAPKPKKSLILSPIDGSLAAV